MAKKRLTDPSIPAIITLDLADLIHVVDVSDTTSHPTGTSKKASIQQIKQLIASYNDQFIELSDTPANYTGSSLKFVRVNSGETGLEFATIDLSGYEQLANKGVANGYVPLNGSTKIDSIYLPSYVDDVLEYADLASFPVSGETGKIYVDIATGKIYRWSGSIYVEISTSSIPTIAQVATAGNLLNSGQDIRFKDGDNLYYTSLSNNQSQTTNKTAYLPNFGSNADGQLAYHQTGIPLTQNYMVKGGANGILQSSTLVYDNGTNVGIGTASPSAKLHVVSTSGTSFKISGSASSNLFSVLDGGYVGINDDGFFSSMLKINSPSNKWALWINNGGISNNGLLVNVNDATNNVSFHTNPNGTLTIQNNLTPYIYFLGSNNSLGIGTSPSAKLHVVSTSGTAFRVDGSTLTHNFVVLDSGKVGISTSNPQALLEVSTQNNIGSNVFFNVGYNISNPIFKIESTTGNNSRIRSVVYDGNFDVELQGFGGVNFNVRHNIYLDELNIGLSGNYNKTYHSGTAEQDGWLEQSYFGGTIIPTRKTTRTITFNNTGGTLVDRYEGLRIRKGTWTNTNAKFHPIIALDGNSGFGTTTPDDSAIVDFTSTTQGVLMPRMTTAQINAIASPANGLMVYNTTIDHVCFYQNGVWERLSHTNM